MGTVLRTTLLSLSCAVATLPACAPLTSNGDTSDRREPAGAREVQPGRVSVGLPPEESPAKPKSSSSKAAAAKRALDARPDTDESTVEAAGGTDVVAALAADAAEYGPRLEAMTKAREAARVPASKVPDGPSAASISNQSNAQQRPSDTARTPLREKPNADRDPISDARASTSTAAPTPASSNKTSDSTMLAAAVESALGTALASRPDAGRPVARALAEAALSIKDPARPFDPATFGALDDDEKALVARFHETCCTIGRDLATGKPAVEAALALTTMTASLAEAKNVSIPRVELCTKVEGFGRVSALENRRFLPGKSTQVIFYTEIDDFSSEQDPKTAEWTTNLSTKLAIYAKHDGTQVWARDWQQVTDRSTVKRDDFFICEKVGLSDFLTLGTYLLKQSVRDEKTGAVAEKSVEFQIVADPALAAR